MIETLSDEEMEQLLIQEHFGHLGCCNENVPHVFPLAYVYHQNTLYGQTTEGTKTTILRSNPNVCFKVQQVHEHGWKSVLCRGMFQELDFQKLETAEAKQLATLLTKKIGSIQRQAGVRIEFSYADGVHPVLINNKSSTLFRIVIAEMTGKYLHQG